MSFDIAVTSLLKEGGTAVLANSSDSGRSICPFMCSVLKCKVLSAYHMACRVASNDANFFLPKAGAICNLSKSMLAAACTTTRRGRRGVTQFAKAEQVAKACAAVAVKQISPSCCLPCSQGLQTLL